MHTLIVVTFLAGATWGPIAAFSQFPSEALCRKAAATTESMIVEMNKTNLISGRPHMGRDEVKTSCVPSSEGKTKK